MRSYAGTNFRNESRRSLKLVHHTRAIVELLQFNLGVLVSDEGQTAGETKYGIIEPPIRVFIEVISGFELESNPPETPVRGYVRPRR